MAQQTTNYNLTKQEDNEYVEINVMNANLDIIDQALKNAGNNPQLEADVAEIKTEVGTTADTGGSETGGTIFAKLNKIIRDILGMIANIGNSNDTGATETTGTVMGKLNTIFERTRDYGYLLGDVTKQHIYSVICSNGVFNYDYSTSGRGEKIAQFQISKEGTIYTVGSLKYICTGGGFSGGGQTGIAMTVNSTMTHTAIGTIASIGSLNGYKLLGGATGASDIDYRSVSFSNMIKVESGDILEVWLTTGSQKDGWNLKDVNCVFYAEDR